MDTEQASLTIPPDSASIAGSRRFTESFLRAHGLDRLTDTMVLLVSEVVTNAIIHGESGAELCLMLTGTTIRAEVRDGSRALPAVKQYSDNATTGRGMLIVESLASSWGTESDPKGKVVWFALDAASHDAVPEQNHSLGIASKPLPTDEIDAVLRAVIDDKSDDGSQSARLLAGALS